MNNDNLIKKNNHPSQKSVFRSFDYPKVETNSTSKIMPNRIAHENTAKIFNSKYVNDNGKWSYNAVNDGLVDFKDYISDINDDLPRKTAYNNKSFKISDYSLQPNSQITQSNTHASFVPNNTKLAKNKLDKVIDKGKSAMEYTENYIEDRIDRSKWPIENLGPRVASNAFALGEYALGKAKLKAKKWGYDSVWNNKADAYRHFTWNALLTRDPFVGYYNARNITNRHEYESMLEKQWIAQDSGGFDYLKDNAIIKGKMNQENFMDLWNNQVGRELANNKDFAHMTIEELFQFAIDYNLLITDAVNTYEFLGITDYITDPASYTVDTEWDLTTGFVTVKKDGKSVTLKIGI